MASITTDRSGSRRIQFWSADGKRQSIRLGLDVTSKAAEAFLSKVEALISDKILGRAHEDDVSRWLRDLDPRMVRRLERVGLASGVGRRDFTLGELFKKFLAAVTVKPSTVTTYEQTQRTLVEHFGTGRHLRTIGPLEADEWRQWMEGQGLAEATISKRVKTARQAFKMGVKWKLIAENPFADVRAGSQTNKSRQRFVPQELIQKVLDACPDAEWRLIVALSRYGGLRCPSEHLLLCWADVDWAAGRMLVRSPKTEHHEGGESRLVPLFTELRPYLLDAFDPSNKYVISSYRGKSCNLRTQLQRIMKRAGVEAWPRLFHNLRATRQTELTNRYPAHVVCAWLGNSEEVARGHYLQVTDAHFAAASTAEPEKICAKDVPHTSGTAGKTIPKADVENENRPVFPGDSDASLPVRRCLVTPAGLERSPENTGQTLNSAEARAKTERSAQPADADQFPDLMLLNRAWPHLPGSTRAAIADLIRPILSEPTLRASNARKGEKESE